MKVGLTTIHIFSSNVWYCCHKPLNSVHTHRAWRHLRVNTFGKFKIEVKNDNIIVARVILKVQAWKSLKLRGDIVTSQSFLVPYKCILIGEPILEKKSMGKQSNYVKHEINFPSEQSEFSLMNMNVTNQKWTFLYQTVCLLIEQSKIMRVQS